MVVQFSILVANNDDLMGLGYSCIEVWQSLDQGNSYSALTSPTALAASVSTISALTTFRMGGKLLKFKINGGSELSVSFSSLVDFWTPQQVSDRINEVSTGTASVVGTNVVLTSSTTGRSSSVEITYSDADDLGLSIGTTYGTDAHLILLPSKIVYLYSDTAGTSGSRYRWRFSNNGTNPISEYSTYVFGTAVPAIGVANLAACSTTFVGLDGKPVKTKVVVASEQNPTAVAGYIVTNSAPLVFESGDDGFIQFSMVRGAKVRVAIEGTTFVREFTVPDAPTFDLLAAMTSAPDPFTIQTVPPFIIRRSI
jgi:hypothetical protein